MKSLPPVSPTKRGIGTVVGDIVAHLTPQGVECSAGTGEMHAGQVLGREYLLADDGAAAGDEVHDSCRYAGLLVYLHQIVVGENGCGGRLPYHGVAHQGGRHREVRCRGQREDEALEGTVFHAVDLVGAALGLDAVDLGGKSGVVAQEVDRLACGVNLCLIEVLALSEHTCGVDDSAVLACEQVGYLEHDGGAYLPASRSAILSMMEARTVQSSSAHSS